MANFSILIVPLIVAFWFSLSSSSSSSSDLPLKPKIPTPTIAASPTVLPGPPLSPVRELSPDIAPLLPHPGSNTIPIIPSTRTPNPNDDVSSVGPDPAFAPSGGEGLLQASSSGMPFLRDSVVLVKLMLSFVVLLLVHDAAF